MFKNEFDGFVDNEDDACIKQDLPIWVCWWQGIDNAPALVKKCIDSIRYNANGHPLYVIDQQNVGEYVDNIPPEIFDRIKEKTFSYAYLADLIRFSLLSKYGGFWIDATMFLSSPLPKQMELSFFSLKRPFDNNDNRVSQKRWSAFFLAATPHNPYIELLRRMMVRYVKENNALIDYLLIDYCMHLLYVNCPRFKGMVDDVPQQECDVYALQQLLNTSVELPAFLDFLNVHPYNKLSWKKNYNLRDDKERETLYSFLINDKWRKK
jgi:hypothetical protein